MDLLLQFYFDSFETLLVFRSWSENVHIIWALSSDYVLSLFSRKELSHINPKENIY